jgi:ribosomal protein S18 acetylase RimI-like enzyme
MSQTRARIREARRADAGAIAELSTTLGYPADRDVMRERLDRLLARADAIVFVAESAGTVVGWLHAAAQELLESGARCEILGLVVDANHRRLGAGRALVDAAERWAMDHELPRMTVRSNAVRVEAHPFYAQLGSERVKTQHAYRKDLTRDAPRGG